MNYAKMQLKAAVTAFVLFAVSSALLFLMARGVGNVAAVLPLPRSLPNYSPGDLTGTLLDVRPVIVLGAGTLLATALLMIIKSTFLDRAVHMLISMLTLLLASSLGVIAGFAGYESFNERHLVVPGGVLPAAIALGVLMLVSCANIEGLRRSLLLRAMLAPILAIGAPILLICAG